MYRDRTNVETEMYDHTANNWSRRNNNKTFKQKFGSCTRKTLDRFPTKDSYTWNITHNTESAVVWNLKHGRWGSLLRLEKKHQEEMTCDKRYIIIIIIIITIIIRYHLYAGCLQLCTRNKQSC